MPRVSPILIKQARAAVEKRAVGPDWSQAVGPAVGALGGAALGGLADRKNRLRGMLLGGGLGAGAGLAAGHFTPEIMAQLERWRNAGAAPGAAPAPAPASGLPDDVWAHEPPGAPPHPFARPAPAPELPADVFAAPGAKRAELIKRARAAVEKRGVLVPLPLIGMAGGATGAALAPRGHRAEGAARGALHGLAIDTGIGLGGGLGLLGGRAFGENYGNPAAGAALGGLGGIALGGLGGHLLARGGLGQPSWDRETPHGVTGAEADDDDKEKVASFGARLGTLAAHYTGK